MATPVYADTNATIYHGDSLEVLKTLPDNSVDSVVTDPPYGLSSFGSNDVVSVLAKWVGDDRGAIPNGKGFMGKSWDAFVPPPSLWDECYRVLKPGGHLLAFAGSRTQDLMGLSIRLAGFEIRDSIQYLYGSGFPKSHNISKALDKMAGAEREVVGSKRLGGNAAQSTKEKGGTYAPNTDSVGVAAIDIPVTAPATDAAKRWEGWGTALKPAYEPVVVARKPLGEPTVASNVLAYGTGGLNIDACRVGTESRENPPAANSAGGASLNMSVVGMPKDAQPTQASGRFPANVILSHSAGCRDTGETVGEAWAATGKQSAPSTALSGGADGSLNVSVSSGSATTPVFHCEPDCPIALIDAQSGTLKGGTWNQTAGARHFENDGEPTNYTTSKTDDTTGGASRYFYHAKANKRERPVYEDADGKRVAHPTVKPLSLCRYLIRLVTPPGGVVLEPFAGSGTTVEAALLEGDRVIAIELTEEYLPLIESRIARVLDGTSPGFDKPKKARKPKPRGNTGILGNTEPLIA